jgi:hypothetical protein
MTEPIWNAFLTERDKAVFKASGYGARGGFGQRPALLVVDVNYAFCDERPLPILESIKRWRNSCGEDAWIAMPYLKSLIEKAHAKGIPVIYTTGVRRADNWDSGSWSWKNGRSGEDETVRPRTDVDGNDIVAAIAPGPRWLRNCAITSLPCLPLRRRSLSSCSSCVSTRTVVSGVLPSRSV